MSNHITPKPASTTETHGDVKYKVTPLAGGLVSYKPEPVTFDPSKLTPTQLDGIACVKCHAEDDAMVPVGSTIHGQVFACAGCSKPLALTDLAAVVDDLGVRPGFAEAVAAEVSAMFAEISQLRAEVAEARKDAKKAEAGALTTFRFGWLAAWQLASELDMSALDVARAAYDEVTRAPFTVAEQQRLMGALFDIADERQGFKSWKPAPMPFDHEGRCDDLTCLSCYPVLGDQLGKSA